MNTIPERQRRRQDSHNPRIGADWTAWTLHFVFGALVGGGLGIFAAYRLGWPDQSSQLVPLTVGFSLIMGGAASHWGDRFWVGRSVFDREASARSRASRRASTIIALAGLPAIGTSVVFALNAHSDRGDVQAPAVRIIILLLAGLFASLCLHGWKTGTVVTMELRCHQHDAPGLYWFLIAVEAAAALGLAATALF